MVRLLVAELLEERGWTAYRLAQETGLTVQAAYRIAGRGGRFGRLEADTLERLCQAFQVQPGALLVWEPVRKRGR
ncbi:MAG: helix-turn-helix domain-containing protein [Gemmatimonadaceae bacterium]